MSKTNVAQFPSSKQTHAYHKGTAFTVETKTKRQQSAARQLMSAFTDFVVAGAPTDVVTSTSMGMLLMQQAEEDLIRDEPLIAKRMGLTGFDLRALPFMATAPVGRNGATLDTAMHLLHLSTSVLDSQPRRKLFAA